MASIISNKSLGKGVQAARKKASLTQEDAAEKASVSYSTLAKIERGAIANPSFTTIARLAHVFGSSLDDLANYTAPASNRKINAIEFVYVDMNGVLVRFFQRAFAHIAQQCHQNPDIVETTFWHYNDIVNRGEMTLKEFNAALSQRLGYKVDWEKEYMSVVEPITAMHACVKTIKKTHKVGLLTNTMPDFVTKMLKNGLLPKVEFDAIVDSSVDGVIKPEEPIYKLAEDRAGVRGDKILFIDDSRTNLMAAERLGWRVLWFDDYRPVESVKRVLSALEEA